MVQCTLNTDHYGCTFVLKMYMYDVDDHAIFCFSCTCMNMMSTCIEGIHCQDYGHTLLVHVNLKQLLLKNKLHVE